MTEQSTPIHAPAFPWVQLLSLYSAITFIMLGIDMALLHLGYRHYHFIAVLPVVFSIVAGIITFFTTFSAWLRRQAWILGVLTVIVGLIGTFIHLEIALANLGKQPWTMLLERLIFDPRPPLAPAALAGTGLLLMLITAAEYWPIPWVIKLCRRLPVIRKMVTIKYPAGAPAEQVESVS